MKGSYRQLKENVLLRANPDNLLLERKLLDDLSTVSYSDVLQYVRVAMKGMEPAYTKASKDAGDAVQTHLKRVLKDVTYRYQGSVMTNTHIKAHSDIDLLVLSEKSYMVDRDKIQNALNETTGLWNATQKIRLLNEQAVGSYVGNSLEDLKEIRRDCEKELSTKYDRCDIHFPKAICVTNQNYHREVDVVIASWYDDVMSIVNDKGEMRGVRIYNKDTHNREKEDFPFLSIKRINERGDATNGRLRRMIRFLKNVKADTDTDIKLSSFDFNAICYDIDMYKYINATYTGLVRVITEQFIKILNDRTFAENIVSVDGREYVFRNNDKLDQVRLLFNELSKIHSDLPANSLI